MARPIGRVIAVDFTALCFIHMLNMLHFKPLSNFNSIKCNSFIKVLLELTCMQCHVRMLHCKVFLYSYVSELLYTIMQRGISQCTQWNAIN